MFVDMSAAVVDELCCFLSCAVHLVLWARRVYPREAFERRRHLDVTVFRSRHVELNEYIALIVQGARQLIERGEADRLVIAVRSGRVVFERFRFDVRYDGRAVDLDALREQLLPAHKKALAAWPALADPETLSAKDRQQPVLADLPAHFTLAEA
jgi:hypothetical protein